ncbi:hypothetical protein L1987_33672 [Smallanthus sonchifolius]|uniref:Uncharacterized protein n=1 Tax=Smallanthus sonchifolius TaxID=185202 RepID=A0ACB9HRF2_9ASTR|nr:hypothetical protein L1987_33672 [Smallanthus sonchifolius]
MMRVVHVEVEDQCTDRGFQPGDNTRPNHREIGGSSQETTLDQIAGRSFTMKLKINGATDFAATTTNRTPVEINRSFRGRNP